MLKNVDFKRKVGGCRSFILESLDKIGVCIGLDFVFLDFAVLEVVLAEIYGA